MRQISTKLVINCHYFSFCRPSIGRTWTCCQPGRLWRGCGIYGWVPLCENATRSSCGYPSGLIYRHCWRRHGYVSRWSYVSACAVGDGLTVNSVASVKIHFQSFSETCLPLKTRLEKFITRPRETKYGLCNQVLSQPLSAPPSRRVLLLSCILRPLSADRQSHARWYVMACYCKHRSGTY